MRGVFALFVNRLNSFSLQWNTRILLEVTQKSEIWTNRFAHSDDILKL